MRSVLLLTALGASSLAAQPAAAPGFTEPEITAAFLSRQMGFVSWRGQLLPKAICVEQNGAGMTNNRRLLALATVISTTEAGP